jgi:ribose 5-phosphate isomerase A
VTADDEKRRAAEAAAMFVESGMKVGLGTGSTVNHLLPALAARHLDLLCVATSPATESAAIELGLRVEPFNTLTELDVAIDGADQVAPNGWIIKGAGGAHTREKVVVAAAHRFVVIVDSSKIVSALSAPVPLELLVFGLAATLARLDTVTLRDVPTSPDGGVIADWHGDVGDPAAVAAMLSAAPGIIEHGLFPPSSRHQLVVGRADGVEIATREDTQ